MRAFYFILALIGLVDCSFSQGVNDRLLGSWVLDSDSESPDLIIFRSDHKYFVYNPNNASVGSLELTGTMEANNIRINGAYTAMTEAGNWSYESSSNELVLSGRSILGEWTDFSKAYGRSSVLKFYLKELTESKVGLCFDNGRYRQCDNYKKSWSYVGVQGTKVFYREILEAFSGTGDLTKSIQLSGYETMLRLSIGSKGPTKVVIRDGNGLELYNFESRNDRDNAMELPLRGITRLVIDVKSEKTVNSWEMSIDVK